MIPKSIHEQYNKFWKDMLKDLNTYRSDRWYKPLYDRMHSGILQLGYHHVEIDGCGKPQRTADGASDVRSRVC